MSIKYKGKTVSGGMRGPVGPDGNPIGTIISYMGLTAPKDYLVCDGTEYNITDYLELARFFEAQFGSKNHFGGDGTVTFAVPDLRNLFLRGYHGDATEQLSGEIGEKQDATEHICFTMDANGILYSSIAQSQNSLGPLNVDDIKETRYKYYGYAPDRSSQQTDSTPVLYTSRPVNAAVLYCIKAVTSVSAEDVYSTEEQVVGRWIDGKPLYSKTFVGTTPSTNEISNTLGYIPNIKNVISMTGSFLEKDTTFFQNIPYATMYNENVSILKPGVDLETGAVRLYSSTAGTSIFNNSCVLTVKYTKTTD